MKWLLVCATFGIICALFVVGGVQPAASAANAASMYQAAPLAQAASMYQVEQIAGTLLTAPQRMYDTGESSWYSAQLRIDQGTRALKVGSTHAVRYLISNRALPELMPGSGDQIRAKVWQDANWDKGWTASESPAILGRGELLRPGGDAAADLGSPKARILVKLLAPLATDCHQKTAQLLRELAAREPDRVRVQLFDMRTVVGRQEMLKERLNCATVLVNNRFQFTLDLPNGKRQVSFQHHPNDPKSLYNSEDVISVIEQEIERLYPQ